MKGLASGLIEDLIIAVALPSSGLASKSGIKGIMLIGKRSRAKHANTLTIANTARIVGLRSVCEHLTLVGSQTAEKHWPDSHDSNFALF